MRINTYIAVLISVAAFCPRLIADDKLTIDHLDEGDLFGASFEIKQETELDIKAVGAYSLYSEDYNAYAWIIDAETRKPVWDMSREDTKGSRKKMRREYDGSIQVRAGFYEVYYYVTPNRFMNIKIDKTSEVFDFFKDIFTDNVGDEWDQLLDEFMVEIKGNGKYFIVLNKGSRFEPALSRKPLLQYSKLRDDYYRKSYFRIDEPTHLHIYLVGEYSSSSRKMVDGSWIINLNNREKVWEPDRWNIEYAGGAEKNRYFNDDVYFDKGDYVLFCWTDDSHSFDDWNAPPPWDPYMWGISILPGRDYRQGQFVPIDEPAVCKPLAQIVRVGDNADEQVHFELAKKADLWIYCFGEYDLGSRSFADHGWIVDDNTNSIVWEMTYQNTEYAGGASKNRVFDGIVKLPAGLYTMVYVTDGSHSFEDWNSRAPYDSENYGISIYDIKGELDEGSFRITEKRGEKGDVLVRMVRLRNDARVSKTFTLSKPSRVRIYAIGEGDKSEMYDFGWIERLSDKQVIWEMTYRNTRPAGGAAKNRKFDSNLMLDKGQYEVNFVTDGSHSYNNWNAAKPQDPESWGITITIR
jgi:hypothetical protein